ncbi:MAG: MMPL family transporter [Bacillota bacterium]|nr:MMPL family transporter [Bacillota bacterium]
MTWFWQVARRYPWAVLGVVALITVAAAFGAARIRVVTDIREFFPQGDPLVATYREVDEKFGGMEYIMVALAAKDVFAPETLQKLDQLTRALQEVPGVRSVRSLTNIEEIRGAEGAIEVAPLVEELPRTPEEIEAFRRRVLSDDFYAGNFVSAQGRTALVMVQVAEGADPVEVSAAVRRVAQEFEGPERVALAGSPTLNELLTKAIYQDLRRLFPLSAALVSLVLYLAFRTARGVALPLATVLLSVVWTLGLMGFLGAPFSQASAMLPPLLVSVGSAYGIHVLSRYGEERRLGLDRHQALERTIASVGLAVFLAAATTMAGFAANGFTKIIRLREFGYLTAFGVGVAFLISVVFIPTLLLLLPDRPVERHRRSANRAVRGFLSWVEHLIARRKRWVALVALLLLALAGFGLPRLTTESDFINFFKPGSEPRRAADLVTAEFGGAQTVEIVVKGDLQDPEVLRRIDRFQEDLKQIKVISKPFSIVDVLKRTNQVMHEGDPAYYTVPDSREAVAQYLLLLSMSGTDLLDRVITFDYGEAKIQARVEGTSSAVRRQMITAVNQAIQRNFGPEMEVTVTGTPVLFESISEMIITSQIQSLALSLVAIYLLISLLTRSWFSSLLCMVPVVVTIWINFSLMGWLGIPLDVVSVLIASVAVGIGIDYSVHVFSRFREELLAGKPPLEAARATVLTVGEAVVYNALAVFAGFALLLWSEFRPVQYFGGLTALTMVVSMAGALLILPALLAVVYTRWPAAVGAGAPTLREEAGRALRGG